MIFHFYEERNQMVNKKNKKKNNKNYSSNSLVFGGWPQTKMKIVLEKNTYLLFTRLLASSFEDIDEGASDCTSHFFLLLSTELKLSRRCRCYKPRLVLRSTEATAALIRSIRRVQLCKKTKRASLAGIATWARKGGKNSAAFAFLQL